MVEVTPMTAGYGSGMSHLALPSGHRVPGGSPFVTFPRSQARMTVLSRTLKNVGGWALSRPKQGRG